MKIEQLISPLDNRYNNKIVDLANNFSESNLNRVRFEIEIEWLIFLCSKGGKNFPALSKAKIKDLQALKSSFDERSAKKIKSIESKTNHDVKAVEYYIRDELKKSSSLRKYEHLVHFALTSEDVNSLSYAILMRDALIIYLKQLDVIIKELNKRARTWSSIPMLARTHGQAASPSTLGKEMKVFVERLKRQRNSLKTMKPLAKFGGATGNYHTLVISDPKINWANQTNKFLASFQVEQNPITTQIEPHDGIAEVAHCIQRVNNILIDFNQDVYGHFMQVELVKKLRDEQKFDTLLQLTAQIATDVADAKQCFNFK